MFYIRCSLILVVARAALCQETVGERQLESRIAILVLEGTRADNSVGILYPIEFVAGGEMDAPLHPDVQSRRHFVFHTCTQLQVGGQYGSRGVGVCAAQSAENKRCQWFRSAVVTSGSVWPEVILVA